MNFSETSFYLLLILKLNCKVIVVFVLVNQMKSTTVLLDGTVLLVLCILFINTQYWIQGALACVLFKYVTSDVGRRCLKVLPRDLK